ncbi:MAG: PAS domain S-box protein [Deltaproteobacteria bacterium]|nr:PAS domain S-box protein [Deltaproteobacteria bacterium]
MGKAKTVNVAIVGGGPGCKAIMDMIFAETLSELRMKLLGVASTDPKAVGYLYAKEKGLYTTRDYRDLYELKDLDMIIEVTGRDEVANEIARTKPSHARFMDHVAARLFWDIFQIEEKRIEGRQRAEEVLRESEEKYRNVVERSNDGIVIIQDGLIKYANPSVKRMTGYDVDAATDTPFSDFIHADEVDEAMEIYKRRLAGEALPTRYERKLRHKNGSRIDTEMDGGLISYEDKPADLVIIRDITKRKQAEKELRESREQLRDLSEHLQEAREEERAKVAREIHDDLGQTLTVLKMDLSWLEKKLPKDQDFLIQKTKLITDLVDMTIHSVKRIYSGLRPFLLDDLGLVAAIEWMAKGFQNQTGIKCELTFSPGEMVVDKDYATNIFRIFQEALTNVRRHANATSVNVRLEEEAGTLTLTVNDNGRGITEEQISHPKSFGIMGIRERVRALGGEVKVRGIKNKGTTVKVSIPTKEAS